MDVIDIVALVLVLLRWVILIPAMIFGLSLLHKYKHNNLFQHRNPTLICIITILCIVSIGFERTFMLCAFVWNIIAVKIWFVYFVFSICWWALFALWGIKVYNLFYQQQYNLSIADQVWKTDINPRTVDFYITNQNKWGNINWLFKICLIPYILSCAAETVFPILFGEGMAMNLFHSAVTFPPVCVALYCVYKTRRFSDVWGIRDETLYQALLIFLCLFIYTIVFCVGYIPYVKHTFGDNGYRFEWTLYSFLSDIGVLSFGIVPIFYPIYLIKKAERSANIRLMDGYLSDDTADSLCVMNRVMRNFHSFQLFMEYLVSEFSVENALFLVELIQIKHDYQKRNNFKVTIANPGDYRTYLEIDFNLNPANGKPYKSEEERYFTYLFHETGTIRGKISLPIQVPKSCIVTENGNSLRAQMRCLYDKYVAVDGLNISYKVHEALDEVFMSKTNGNDEHVLFNAMDQCAMEVLVLLQQSFARFICHDASVLEQNKSELEFTNDDEIRSDIKMKELLNSNNVPIVSKKELLVYYNF